MKSALMLRMGGPILCSFLSTAIGKRQSKQEQPKQAAGQETRQQPKIEKEPEHSWHLTKSKLVE
jgi:hypothetical protein